MYTDNLHKLIYEDTKEKYFHVNNMLMELLRGKYW